MAQPFSKLRPPGVPLTTALLESLAEKLPNGCWIWPRAKTPFGYGVIRRQGGKTQAYVHRLAWELWYGPIPDRACVLHRCDNPSCINPAHLFLGTKVTNNLDRDQKGRTRKGERHADAKLTVTAVRQIRQMEGTGLTKTEIGALFGVSRQAVNDVMRRRNWKQVE